MSEGNGLTRQKHPFVELLTAISAMLALPALVYVLLSAVMREYSNYSPALIAAQAEAFAGICGSVFALILYKCGLFIEPFVTFISRWSKLISYIRYDMGEIGWKAYLTSLKEDGVTFLGYVLLTGFELFLVFDGLNKFVAITGITNLFK